MKKLRFSAAALVILSSCSKNELQHTRDTVLEADSLFKSANSSIKTLDSISAVVRDSARYNRVIVPEIEKTKKNVEKTIRENSGALDSLSSTISKVKAEINKGSDILKTVDSANQKLRGEGNVFDKISTITETISKVTKKTSSTPAPQKPRLKQDSTTGSAEHSDSYSPQPDAEKAPEADPMVKRATLEIAVSNTEQARASLTQILRSNGADIATESFTDAEGVKKQYILAKVPLRNFEKVVNEISSSTGNNVSKSMESNGTDYRADQMCDVAVTFSETLEPAGVVTESSPQNGTFGERSSEALGKGFKSFGELIIMLLPFLPFIIIAGLIWYFAARAKRKREERQLLRQQELQNSVEKLKNAESSVNENELKNSHKTESEENDYSRFMPK